MQTRVRESYRRQASQQNWLRLDGERPKDAIAADVFTAVGSRLSLP
jgi:thymidylate kinase